MEGTKDVKGVTHQLMISLTNSISLRVFHCCCMFHDPLMFRCTLEMSTSKFSALFILNAMEKRRIPCQPCVLKLETDTGRFHVLSPDQLYKIGDGINDSEGIKLDLCCC